MAELAYDLETKHKIVAAGPLEPVFSRDCVFFRMCSLRTRNVFSKDKKRVL